MPVISTIRQQGKSILAMWADLKRRHLIDFDPMDELMNNVVAYYCIIPEKYAKFTGGITHARIERLTTYTNQKLNDEFLPIHAMAYIQHATVVWAETRDGRVFCYKSRIKPKEDMRISDEDFCMLKLTSKNC